MNKLFAVLAIVTAIGCTDAEQPDTEVQLRPKQPGAVTSCGGWRFADWEGTQCQRSCCDVYLSGVISCYTELTSRIRSDGSEVCWPPP